MSRPGWCGCDDPDHPEVGEAWLNNDGQIVLIDDYDPHGDVVLIGDEWVPYDNEDYTIEGLEYPLVPSTSEEAWVPWDEHWGPRPAPGSIWQYGDGTWDPDEPVVVIGETEEDGRVELLVGDGYNTSLSWFPASREIGSYRFVPYRLASYSADPSPDPFPATRVAEVETAVPEGGAPVVDPHDTLSYKDETLDEFIARTAELDDDDSLDEFLHKITGEQT